MRRESLAHLRATPQVNTDVNSRTGGPKPWTETGGKLLPLRGAVEGSPRVPLQRRAGEGRGEEGLPLQRVDASGRRCRRHRGAQMKRKAASQANLLTMGGHISHYRVEGSTLVPHWTCNYCGRAYKGQLNRARAHILQLAGKGIAVCDHAIRPLEEEKRRQLECEGQDAGMGWEEDGEETRARTTEPRRWEDRDRRALGLAAKQENLSALPTRIPGFPFGTTREGKLEVRVWMDLASSTCKKSFFLLLDTVLPLYQSKADFWFQLQVQPWNIQSMLAHEVALAAYRAGGLQLFWKTVRILFGSMSRMNDELMFEKSRNELVRTMTAMVSSSIEESDKMLRYLLLPIDGGDRAGRDSLLTDLQCHVRYGRQLSVHNCPAVFINGIQAEMGGSWTLPRWQRILDPVIP